MRPSKRNELPKELTIPTTLLKIVSGDICVETDIQASSGRIEVDGAAVVTIEAIGSESNELSIILLHHKRESIEKGFTGI